LLATALLVIANLAVAVADTKPGGAKKSDAVVKITAKADKPAADGTQMVSVTLKIDKGWHVYANPVGNDDLKSAQTDLTVAGPDKPQVVKTVYPKGNLTKDKLIGDYQVYEGEVSIKATVKRPPGSKGPLEASVKLQACSEKACLQPATVKIMVVNQ
jgi:DsbC/DsbD-like thiol-disulfide interchange protein